MIFQKKLFLIDLNKVKKDNALINVIIDLMKSSKHPFEERENHLFNIAMGKRRQRKQRIFNLTLERIGDEPKMNSFSEAFEKNN